jgi:hypothetical protein
MPRVEIPDFENTKVFTLLDPGVYNVEVDGIPLVENNKKGNPQIIMTMTVTDGPTQQTGDNPFGRKIKDFIPFALSTKVKALLLACGVLTRDDTTSEIAKGGFDTEILMGARLQVRLTRRMYNGNPQNDVAYVI